MLSTFMNYRLYSSDMTKSLARISSQATVQRESDYYKTNIGKVTSAEELLKDQRLYAYAMKAYGLEDQIASRGLMKKVLESDLTDANSFANKLVDTRYREFASAFQFGSANDATIQTQAQQELLTEAYSEHRVRAANKVAATVAEYNAKVNDGTFDSVAKLLADPVGFKLVATVAGLDPDAVDKTAVRAQLTSALTSTVTTTNTKLGELKSRFNFQPNGSLTPGAKAQDAAALADLSATYFDEVGSGNSSQAAAYKTTYFAKLLDQFNSSGNPGTVDIAEYLVKDDQALKYVLNAFGIDPTYESAAYIKNVLTADPPPAAGSMLTNLPQATDANKRRRDQLVALNAAFNFGSNGSVPAGQSLFASGYDFAKLEAGYFRNYQTSDIASDKTRTSTFVSRLSNMESINDLLGRDAAFGKAAFDYILKAFDIDPATESSSKIRRVLMSDASDPKSYVNRLNDERYEKLAAAFNFGSDGKATTPRLVQSISAQTTTGTRYTASFGSEINDAKKELIKADTQKYLDAISSIRSLDDLIDDNKTVKYALRAYGLQDETISDRDLRKLLTSDLSDPKSFANAKGDKRFVEFAASFNFTTDGLVKREAEGAQGGSKLLTTQNKYLLQTMESQVGENSEGARLALYFLRKAPDVTSAYGILSDKALFEVARTALSLPAGMSNMAIESQAKLLESKIDFSDFQDAKKLDKFITRFASLYDLANSSTASSPILALFGNSGGSNGILGYL